MATRVNAAAIGLLAISLLTIFQLLLDSIAAKAPDESASIPVFETRFDEVKKAVPPDAVLGYITDSSMADPNVQAEYFVAQYALAPRVVANRADQKLVLGVIHNPTPTFPNLPMIRDFGNGIRLYRGLAR